MSIGGQSISMELPSAGVRKQSSHQRFIYLRLWYLYHTRNTIQSSFRTRSSGITGANNVSRDMAVDPEKNHPP
ncbi:hypothetical protein RRG08_029125 [Elysia crispata]|uniref:Uncharacterized protein n=1 Tax=Elysia crispata TaxID=231223 RepID=A0AAE1CTD3_9GAST|nr:hypothetical protein RRG08_029125 [Elysia crispata]